MTSTLLEIRKLRLTIKNLLHKGVDVYVQNVLKLTHEYLSFQNFFQGVIAPDIR